MHSERNRSSGRGAKLVFTYEGSLEEARRSIIPCLHIEKPFVRSCLDVFSGCWGWRKRRCMIAMVFTAVAVMVPRYNMVILTCAMVMPRYRIDDSAIVDVSALSSRALILRSCKVTTCNYWSGRRNMLTCCPFWRRSLHNALLTPTPSDRSVKIGMAVFSSRRRVCVNQPQASTHH